MSKSILLADDSATIRRVVEVSFTDTEFHVESVADGEAALARLETLHPDIVLADVVMPGPSGYEICRRVKASAHPVPVLLLAGTFEEFDRELARSSGADGCLMKPFESRTLLERVTSLLADREGQRGAAVEPLPDLPEPAAAAPEPVAVTVDESLPAGFDEATLDAIARAVVRRLSGDVIRQIADEVVPRVAETLVRQRIRELEDEEA
jgi:DNA-binding response OmpR family regulator